jgi:hypothetical protein
MRDPVEQASVMLLKAIQELDQDATNDAMISIGQARTALVNSLPLILSNSSEYGILRRVFFLSQCVMLHYLALAQREEKQENDILRLAYLSQALGVNSMLESSLIPLLLRHAEEDRHKREITRFSDQNQRIRDELCRSISHQIDATQRILKGKIKEAISSSITKIVNSVSRNSDEIRESAVKLSARFPAGDFKQARKIFEFVRDEIQYIYDPLGFEQVQLPETTLKLRAGDCEDQAILLCSFLISIGFKSALIFADANSDGVADHVYSAVYIPDAPDYSKPLLHKVLEDGTDMNDWIPLDPTSQNSDFGVIPVVDVQITKFVLIPQELEIQQA